MNLAGLYLAGKKVKLYDLREHNIDCLRHALGTYDWSAVYQISEISIAYQLFINIVLDLIAKCVPAKTVAIAF